MCEKCQGTGEVALRAERGGIVERPFDPRLDHDPWPCGCRSVQGRRLPAA